MALALSLLSHSLNVHLGRAGAQAFLTQHHVQLGGRHQGVVGEGAGGRGDDPGGRQEGPGTEWGVGGVETVRYPGNIAPIT